MHCWRCWRSTWEFAWKIQLCVHLERSTSYVIIRGQLEKSTWKINLRGQLKKITSKLTMRSQDQLTFMESLEPEASLRFLIQSEKNPWTVLKVGIKLRGDGIQLGSSGSVNAMMTFALWNLNSVFILHCDTKAKINLLDLLQAYRLKKVLLTNFEMKLK